MKKIILAIAAISISALTLNAQAQKLTDEDLKPITKTLYAGENISGLKIIGRFNVSIKHGTTTKAEISASKFIFDDLDIALSNEKLKISIVNNNENSVNKLFDKYKNDIVRELIITTPNFNHLVAVGMADVKFLSEFSCEDLDIEAVGMSDIDGAKFNVTGKSKISSAGMSDITNAVINGGTTATIQSVGMSDLDVTIKKTELVNIDSAGMSDIKVELVNAGEVVAECSGMSDIEVDGTCKSLRNNESGMSNISSDVEFSN